MSNFTKNIQTQKGILTFYFNRIYTVNGIKYHVSVKNERLSHYFMMGCDKEQWHFTDATVLPEWIIAVERKLEEAINEYLRDS